jgi:hypothetical protein
LGIPNAELVRACDHHVFASEERFPEGDEIEGDLGSETIGLRVSGSYGQS